MPPCWCLTTQYLPHTLPSARRSTGFLPVDCVYLTPSYSFRSRPPHARPVMFGHLQVARLSRIGQERRKNRKLTRQRREKKRRSALNNGWDGVRKGAEREGTGNDVGDDAAAQGAEEGGLVTTEAGGEGTDVDGPGKREDSRHDVDEDSISESEEWFLMAGTWISRWHAYILSGMYGRSFACVFVRTTHGCIP